MKKDKTNICLRLDAFDYVMLHRFAGQKQMSLQEYIREIIKEHLYNSIQEESEEQSKVSVDRIIDINIDPDTTLHYDVVLKRFVF